MPIIKQAVKRVRQSETRRKRNYNVRTALKKSLRGAADAVKAGDKKEATSALQKAYKVIDMATKKRVLHKNTAARRKSSLSKAVSKLS